MSESTSKYLAQALLGAQKPQKYKPWLLKYLGHIKFCHNCRNITQGFSRIQAKPNFATQGKSNGNLDVKLLLPWRSSNQVSFPELWQTKPARKHLLDCCPLLSWATASFGYAERQPELLETRSGHWPLHSYFLRLCKLFDHSLEVSDLCDSTLLQISSYEYQTNYFTCIELESGHTSPHADS